MKFRTFSKSEELDTTALPRVDLAGLVRKRDATSETLWNKELEGVGTLW